MNKIWYDRTINCSFLIVVVSVFAMDWRPQYTLFLTITSLLFVALSTTLYFRRNWHVTEDCSVGESVDVASRVSSSFAVKTGSSYVPAVTATAVATGEICLSDIRISVNDLSKFSHRWVVEDTDVDVYLRYLIQSEFSPKVGSSFVSPSLDWVPETHPCNEHGRRLTDNSYAMAA